MWKESGGWTVLSVLIALILFSMVATLGGHWIRRTIIETRFARVAHGWMSDVLAVQARALRSNRRYGLVAERQRRAGRTIWGYRICMDGNGNGLTRTDLVAGIDPCGPFRPLERPPSITIVGRTAARPSGLRWGAHRMIVCNPWGICSSATTCWAVRWRRPSRCITWIGHLGRWQ